MSRIPSMALAACLLTPGLAGAQSPWRVTVKPNAVLAIGTCGGVQVTVVDPARNNTPQNDLGAPVTIADFDMTVTTPDGRSVAGQQIDAGHWAACACQGAAPGTVATITATYPARSLPKASVVRGVAFQATNTFTIGAAQGTSNPPVCPAPTGKTAMGAAPLGRVPAAMPAAVPPAPPPAPVTVTPPPPPPMAVALPNQVVRGAPPAPLPAGAPPRNVAVTGNPAEANVRWDPPTGSPAPTSYRVERWKTADPACCRATSPVLPHQYSNRWTDAVQWTGAWSYQVTAVYADGRVGTASAAYTYPDPVMPTGLKAVQTDKNTVVVSWAAVQGAAYYLLGGPPTNTVFRVNGTSHTQTGVQPGNTTWQVSTAYEGTAPGTPKQGSAYASTTLAVVNTRYRLVAEAIRVTAETVDKPLSEDGMYDEIYLASFAELHQRAAPGTGGQQMLERQPLQQSHVHGDITYWIPSDRRQAGTASANGGIRAGDVVSPIWTAPNSNAYMGAPGMVLWEGDLIPGKHDLILHPTIWELDQPTSEMARKLDGAICFGYMCSWWKFMNGPGGDGSGFHAAAKAAIAGSQIAIVDQDKVWLGTSGGGPIFMERHDRDRPLGLVVKSTAPGSWGLMADMIDKMVVLSSEKIEAALAAGRNRIDVRFWDHWELPGQPYSSVNWLNGDYTLVIRIERVP